MANQSYAPILHNNDHVLVYTVTTFDHPFANNSIVFIMTLAWFVLIAAFSLCCCSQCFRRGFWSSKWRSCGLDGGASECGDDWCDTNSIATVSLDVDRTNNNENIDVCRNCPPNYEAESLPSYTIVSGLPSYDDAIEQFRKAQSLLTPPIPIIKLFEANEKNRDHIYSIGGGISDVDNVSVASLNSCSYCSSLNTSENNAAPQIPTMNNTQLIELSPEQLASLSEKRLSLQIVFPPHTVRNSRPRVDLRNNLLRSRILVNAAGYEGNFPQIHRSNSLRSLSYERDNTHMMQLNFQHRGSLH